MRSPFDFRAPFFATSVLAVALAVGTTLVAPFPAVAQFTDPEAVLAEMKEMQAEFERYREEYTAINRNIAADHSCDERIGRMCIWFGGEDEASFPPELTEVAEARRDLIRALTDAVDEAPHRWILGQLVYYLIENGNVREAERFARECGIDETWWCDALQGYALHMRSAHIDAEAAFRIALEGMPDEDRERWLSLRWVLTPGAAREVDELSPEERLRTWEKFWRLSDPLFIYEGNDRLTDHFARLLIAETRRDAGSPPTLQWEEDVEEALVRYGRTVGYSRSHDPSRMLRGGGLQDTRRMVEHHHPKSRGYLFPEDFLESPSDIPPESWITAPREARTWYAPLYAPDMRGLETQVGRFRRDESMLVVGAYRPTIVNEEGEAVPVWGPDDEGVEPPHASLFLVPEDEGPPFNVLSREAEGVLTLEGPPGRYVSSFEVVDVQNRRAWRARQGIVQRPLEPGLISVSDLLILKEGAPLPESLDEALPYVRPGVRLRAGERFPVLWEVYGLRIREPVRVTIGFSRGRPGFLERVGEFLGVIEPEQQVDVTFDDLGPDQVQAIFRSVELELPDLDPGEYTLHLRLELSGRTPVVTSRPIVVEG